MTFPLKLATLSAANSRFAATPHLAVIGNAAQTMHPVAGQGFNVGLRDAFELAQQIVATNPADYGGEQMLKAYQQGRQTDTKRGLLFTDFLVNIFSNDLMGLSTLRGAGLGLFDLAKPLKRKLVNKMSFGSHG
jgi:2-octaprenyl-6-methoxyphenol hydroxylase